MTFFKHPIRRFRRRGVKPATDLTSGSISKPLSHELDRLVSTGLDSYSKKVYQKLNHLALFHRYFR